MTCQPIEVSVVAENVIEASISETTINSSISETQPITVAISETTIAVDIAETVVIEAGVSQTQQINVAVSGGIGGGTAEQTASVFVTGVTSTGIVGSIEYVADTIPANKVISSAYTDASTVTISFQADGGGNYSPVISIGTIECTNLQQVANDLRIFTGSIDVSITQAQETFVISSDAGSSSSITIYQADDPPEVQTCLIGSYPGTQTTAKEGDSIEITGTVSVSASHVRVRDDGAFLDSGWIVCSGGVFTIPGSVGTKSGLQGCNVYAKNSFGTEGSNFTATNQITLDQTVPTFVNNSINYPTGQLAFKGVESGTVDITVSDFTSVSYFSTVFQISNFQTYEKVKTVTCSNPGTYNDNVANYTITALKSSNDSQSTLSIVLEIADLAPILSVSQAFSRLRSDTIDSDFIVSVSSNQNLLAAPDLNIPVSGTWKGAGFSGVLKDFTRELTLTDADAKGTGAWTLATVARNRAGIAATITGDQVVGGFVERSYSMDAFSNTVNLNTEVVDVSKLVLTWTGKDNMTFQPIGTSAPVVAGFTIDSLAVNPTQIIILDTQATASISQASTVTIEETI